MDDPLEHRALNSTSTLAGVAYSLRPWQWYKQVIVLVPVAFSFRYFDVTDFSVWLRVTAGIVLFTLTAGCIYVLNDIMDREADRNHPRKQHRPIASGQVTVTTAISLSVPGIILGPALGWLVRPALGLLLCLYALQNIIYSSVVKQFLFIDLIVIGFGFVIRAVVGVVLVGAPVSPWLILCTFLTALLFGIGKRWGEFETVDYRGETRQTLDGYSPEILRALFISVSSMLLVSYSLYTFFVRADAMMLTIPFALYAVFRYGYLIIEVGIERPERVFLDRPLVANTAIWALFVFSILYVLPRVSVGDVVPSLAGL